MVKKRKTKNEKRKTPTLKLKTGDTVKVLRGKDRGKQAKLLAVLPAHGRVLVEGVNMVNKHIRPRRAGEKGQRVSVAAPFSVANVQLVCPSCKQAARVSVTREGGTRQRVCKKCQAVIS